MRFNYKNKIMVAGHAGDLDNFPENTMQSFRSAIEKGADMIEADLRMSKDGVIVLMHDSSIDKTTDGTGNVKDKTYEELYKYNAGTADNFQHIPTLEELLKLVAQNDVLINLELKDYYDGSNVEFCREAVDKTVTLVEKYNLASKCVFNSFDAFILEYIDHKYNGKYRLHGFYPYNIMKNVVRNPDEYLYCACVFDDKNRENYEYLKNRRIEVWMGSNIKEKEDFKRAVEWGGILFTSDDPKKAIQILEELGLRK